MAARAQRGFLLVVAAILIAVAAVMAAVILTLSAGGSGMSVKHLTSAQAFYAAEAGLEQGLYERNRNTWDCSTPASHTGTVGSGGAQASYSVTCTLYNPTSSTVPAGGVNATSSVIPLSGNPSSAPTLYAPFGRVRIGYETIYYSAIGTAAECSAAGYTYCLVGAQRGVEGSAANSHSAGAAVSQNQYIVTSVGSGQDSAQRTLSAAITPANLLPFSSNANFNLPSGTCTSPGCSPTGWTLSATPSGSFTPWNDTGGPDGSRAAYALKASTGPSTATNAGQFSFSPPIKVTAPVTLTLTFDYNVIRSPTSGGSGNEVGYLFTLQQESPGTGSWSSAEFESGNTSTYQSASVSISVTGTGVISIDRLSFSMNVKAGRPKEAWLDNIFVQTSGTQTYLNVIWRESFP